ncbi:hypothetical protein GCM10010182_70940 [Actinomadura cremea]|nr:hypothetical protein GCM10010182_70940 [Actinomadura cremea]
MLIGYTPLWQVRTRTTGRTPLDALREARTAYSSANTAEVMTFLPPSPATVRRLEKAQA